MYDKIGLVPPRLNSDVRLLYQEIAYPHGNHSVYFEFNSEIAVSYDLAEVLQ